MKIRSIIKNSFKVKGFIFGLVVLLSFISFGYSDNVATLLQTTEFTAKTFTKNVWSYIYQLPGNDSYSVCFTFRNYNGSLRVGVGQNPSSEPGTNFIYWADWAGNYVCLNKGSVDRYIMVMPIDSTTSVGGDFFNLNGLLNTELPLMSSLECQTEYGLIPSSSVDQNYCVNNNLCPYYYLHINQENGDTSSSLISNDLNIYTSSGILVDSSSSPVGNFYFTVDSSYTGGSCELLSGNWSALYINNIQHVGAPLINITIPEEFDWDYIYTGNGDEFDLDIKGYNVDTAYIDGIITTQKSLPNNTDFTNILSGLIPLFIPGLVIIACLYFIFRFIKKVF